MLDSEVLEVFGFLFLECAFVEHQLGKLCCLFQNIFSHSQILKYFFPFPLECFWESEIK